MKSSGLHKSFLGLSSDKSDTRTDFPLFSSSLDGALLIGIEDENGLFTGLILLNSVRELISEGSVGKRVILLIYLGA